MDNAWHYMRWRDLDNVLNTSRDGMASAESSWVTQAFYQRLHSVLFNPPPKKKDARPISPIGQGKSSKPAWENLSEPQPDRKVKVPQRSHTKLGHCSCTYDDGTSFPKETYHRVVLEDGTTNVKKTTWAIQACSNIWVNLDEKMLISKLLSTYYIYIYTSVWACFHHQQYSR